MQCAHYTTLGQGYQLDIPTLSWKKNDKPETYRIS